MQHVALARLAHTPGLVLWTTTEVLLHEQRPLTTIWLQVFDSAVKLCDLAVDDHFPTHCGMTHGLALKKSSMRLFQALSQRESHKLLDLSFSSIIILWLSYIFSTMCLFNRVPARDVPSLILFYLFD